MDGDLLTGDLPVHPLADIFPMMSHDELTELADDIKANGLIHPLMRDPSGVLIDGRNRLAACRLAGVEPRFETFTGEPAAYIVAANLHRRSLSKGQQAMALAMIYPEAPDRGGRGNKRASETDGVSATRLKLARAVLRFSPDLAQQVLTGPGAGGMGLDDAYSVAKRSDEQKRWRDDALGELRAIAPDLAERVAADELSLDEARTLVSDRQKQRRESRRLTFQMLAEFLDRARSIAASPDALRDIDGWLSDDEAARDFRSYFPDGVADLVARSQFAEGAAEAVIDLRKTLEKRK